MAFKKVDIKNILSDSGTISHLSNQYLLEIKNNFKDCFVSNFLLPKEENNQEDYSNNYDNELKHYLLDCNNCFLFYTEKFPSLITKVRSYKGLLREKEAINKEFKINSSESYFSFLLPVQSHTIRHVFEYFFTPNNCFLLCTNNKSKVIKILDNILQYNFYQENSSFWFDYFRLCIELESNERIIHYYVNPNNENEFGFRVYENTGQIL